MDLLCEIEIFSLRLDKYGLPLGIFISMGLIPCILEQSKYRCTINSSFLLPLMVSNSLLSSIVKWVSFRNQSKDSCISHKYKSKSFTLDSISIAGISSPYEIIASTFFNSSFTLLTPQFRFSIANLA